VQVISGLRVARSYISPVGITAEIQEIDFQLGARQGVAIHAVLATMNFQALNVSSSVQTIANFIQSLHLEVGALETLEFGTTDEVTVDSEIFFRQEMTYVGNDDLTTEFRSAAAMVISPAGLITFAEPILTSRNITHQGDGSVATWSVGMHITLYYKFVEFSLSELGVLLARRA